MHDDNEYYKSISKVVVVEVTVRGAGIEQAVRQQNRLSALQRKIPGTPLFSCSFNCYFIISLYFIMF